MHKMRPKFLCCSLPVGLMFGFCVFLLRPVSTQKNRNRMYFLDKGDVIVLNGMDNAEKDTVVVWELKPHSGKDIEILATFRRTRSDWIKQKAAGKNKVDLYLNMKVNYSTLDLTIEQPTFKLAGIFTLTQTKPRKQILKQYEIFGMKVEASPQRPLLGSDVTLSCTISRLSDTVSLHWRPMDSPQQNRSNTDQIRLDNTVYLMVQHVTVEDGKYVCDVQENGNIVHTSNGDFTVDTDLSKGRYTLYRSSTDHSELHLVCAGSYGNSYSRAQWTWTPHHLQQQKVIASAERSQPINVKGTDFGNRLVTSGKPFDGKDFSVRIVPVWFQDAGIYTCFLDFNLFSIIDLITVKVTAEPSDAVTEGDTVTLTCSVSRVTESMRLVWINGDGKIVGEKTLTVDEKLQSLVIQKAERGRGNWRCGLFHQDLPRLVVPYYQEPRENHTSIFIIVGIIGSLAVLLVIILAVMFCQRKRKPTEINDTPVLEMSRVAEYMSVSRKTKQEDTEEGIHYGFISFQPKAPGGNSDNTLSSHQASGTNIVSSKEDESSVIYAETATTKT